MLKAFDYYLLKGIMKNVRSSQSLLTFSNEQNAPENLSVQTVFFEEIAHQVRFSISLAKQFAS